jgi:hypothetical protein
MATGNPYLIQTYIVKSVRHDPWIVGAGFLAAPQSVPVWADPIAVNVGL